MNARPRPPCRRFPGSTSRARGVWRCQRGRELTRPIRRGRGGTGRRGSPTLRAYLEGDDRQWVNDAQLVVSEVVANSILHAYHDMPAGRVDISFSSERAGLQVRVRDYGCGFTENSPAAGAGLGLRLTAVLADHVECRRPSEGGHEVVLGFTRPPSDR
jgi:anti-sigma regulatory factor (Ser/Thr protein kinase)